MLNKSNIIAEGVKLLSNANLLSEDDYRTWYGYYDKFGKIDNKMNHALSKIIWATYIHKTKPNYNISEDQIIQLAKMAPDTCPVEGTPLIYWIGKNSPINPTAPGCFHHLFYQPSIDHITPVIQGGPWHIDNYQIISNEANRIKNSRFTNHEDLDSWYKGMKKILPKK